jgi:hypothetical protein
MLLITTCAITFAIITTIDVTHATTFDETANGNPLLSKWEGPYEGFPPFDRVQIALFKPALESAMAEQLVEVDRIAKAPRLQTSKIPSSHWNTQVVLSIESAQFTAFEDPQ